MENAQQIKEKYMDIEKKYELIEIDLSYNTKMSLGRFLSINDAVDKAKDDYENFLFQSFGRNKNSVYRIKYDDRDVCDLDSLEILKMLKDDKQKYRDKNINDNRRK